MKIIGLGTDIIEIARIKKSIEEYGEKFLNKIFTINEIEYCQNKKNSFQHYAVRFAAKESVMKVFATGWRLGVNWKNIEIVNTNSGEPKIRILNETKKIQKKLSIKKIFISLSHSENYAAATAIGIG